MYPLTYSRNFWFFHKDERHRYRVSTSKHGRVFKRLGSGVREFVTFTTPDEDKYPLPDPRFLKIHAACCKVAHVSGAADYLNMLEENSHYDPYAPVPAHTLATFLHDLLGQSTGPGLVVPV